MEIELAPDVQEKIEKIVADLELLYIEPKRIISVRSKYSKSRARARIWGFPRIWQLALKLKPHYVIEVLSEKYDHLKIEDQKRILVHELMHIPKNFSGALLPHTGRGRVKINPRTVEVLFRKLKKIRRC